MPFFGYPEQIRRVIYTTNAVESLNAQLRKVTKKRGAFPTEDLVRKILYLAIMRASNKWTIPFRTSWPRWTSSRSCSGEGCRSIL